MPRASRGPTRNSTSARRARGPAAQVTLLVTLHYWASATHPCRSWPRPGRLDARDAGDGTARPFTSQPSPAAAVLAAATAIAAPARWRGHYGWLRSTPPPLTYDLRDLEHPPLSVRLGLLTEPRDSRGDGSLGHRLSPPGAGAQNRTGDTRILSPVLHHLSYPGTSSSLFS